MFSLAVLLAIVSRTLATSLPDSNSVWRQANFDSLLTFGDSYTDENRLNYFALHKGAAPPPGTLLPESNSTASGGKTWPRYVIQYAGSKSPSAWEPKMTLYDYAVSGAVCSNEITPRQVWCTHVLMTSNDYDRTFQSINADFPAVLEYELPAFLSDQQALRINTTTPYFTPTLSATNAAFAIWIGTNDLGVNAFLTDSQVPGKVLADYLDCVYNVLDGLYAAGGRVFVLFNAAPLHLSPLYANTTIRGVTSSAKYWPHKDQLNITQYAEVMHEFTSSVNAVYKYRTPYEALVARRYPGASFASFNVNQLMQDMYDSPEMYFNGTSAANVTGFENHCVQNATGDGTICSKAEGGMSPDSFMWYDELHPSTQTDRVIARSFLDVLNGNSTYADYW